DWARRCTAPRVAPRRVRRWRPAASWTSASRKARSGAGASRQASSHTCWASRYRPRLKRRTPLETAVATSGGAARRRAVVTAAREVRAAKLVVHPGLEAERRDPLQHTRNDAGEDADLVLRMRVGAHGEEMEQVVEVDLPVPLRVGGKREVDACQLARDVVADQPLVLLGGEPADGFRTRDGIGGELSQRRTAATLPVAGRLRLEGRRL